MTARLMTQERLDEIVRFFTPDEGDLAYGHMRFINNIETSTWELLQHIAALGELLEEAERRCAAAEARVW